MKQGTLRKKQQKVVCTTKQIIQQKQQIKFRYTQIYIISTSSPGIIFRSDGELMVFVTFFFFFFVKSPTKHDKLSVYCLKPMIPMVYKRAKFCSCFVLCRARS